MGFFSKVSKAIKKVTKKLPKVVKAVAPIMAPTTVGPYLGVAAALMEPDTKAVLRAKATTTALTKVGRAQARSIMPMTGGYFDTGAATIEAGGDEEAILSWCANQGLLSDYQPASGQAFYSPLAAGAAGVAGVGSALMKLPAAAPAAMVATAIRGLLAGGAAGGEAGVAGVASGLLARLGPAAVVAALGYAAVKGAPKLWRWALKKLGFKFPHKHRRRGISSSDIRRTFRTLRTVNKIVGRMPKARGRGGRRSFARAAAPGVNIVDVD